MDRKLPKNSSYFIIQGFSRVILRTLVQHTYILLFIALSIIAYPIIGPGMIIGGDFPVLDTGNYAYDKLWIWLDKGGVPIYEGISRFPITSLWYILSFVGIDAAAASKIMILVGFFIASFSFYFSFLLFFRGKLMTSVFSKENFSLKLGAILGSLFFAYNVWSFQRIAHWHLWIGYCLIPLFFVSTYLSFRNPRDWKYILCSVFLWSFASMTPHMTVFYGIIFASIFLFFLFRYLVGKKLIGQQVQILLPFFLVLSLFSLVNFYWIYPYILGSDVRTISPDYVIVRENIEHLSSDSSFLNTFRILADYQGALERYYFQANSFLDSLWLVATFAIPIFAFATIIISKRLLKYTIIFSGIAVIGIFAAMGTNSFYDYYNLLIGLPILSNYIWLFRDPDKFTFLITFGYSFLIGIGAYTVLRNIRHTRTLGSRKKTVFSILFMLLLVGSICVYSFPVFNSHILNRYKPVHLPSELDALNDYLSGVETDKVYFIPYPLAETYWKKDSLVGRIYQMHSIKPSIESTKSSTMNYYSHLISSIMENRSKGIDDLIYPLGTSYLIFHNDTWSMNQNNSNLENKQLLDRIFPLDGIKNIQSIGFYKIFKVGNESGRQFNLYKENIIAIGGLELLDTLNAMHDFSVTNSSIAFIDDSFPKQLKENVESSDVIVTGKSSLDDLVFSFIDDKYFVSPFEMAHNYNPSRTWSKVGATDPLHGEFHPFLERLGINNREFDFGRGLAMTTSIGANITIPLDVSEDGQYDLVVRLLENSRGGTLNIYLDDRLIDTVDTLSSKTSNRFVWKNISDHPVYLTNGKHTITLQNVIGLNAAGMIAAVPSDTMNNLLQKAHKIITTKKIIYLLEVESSFDNKKGRDMHRDSKVFNNSTEMLGNSTSISGQFRVPQDSDLVSLQLVGKNGTNIDSSSDVKNFMVFPSQDKINLFNMDFERNPIDSPLGLLRSSEWINYNQDALYPSMEMANAISGNASLRVDVNPVDRSDWSILATDLVPIKDNRNYKLSMDVRGNDVKNFHVRIIYYDSNMTRIYGERNVIYESDNHYSFDDKFASSIVPPKSSEFLRIQILVAPEYKRYGTYFIDDVKIDEIIPIRSVEFKLGGTENKSITRSEKVNTINSQSSLVETSNKSAIAKYNIQETDSISVDENHLYNYTANIKNKKSDSLVGLLNFKSTNDVVENSSKYDSNASSGTVLSMAENSEIYGEVEIIKPANYTIGLRSSTCENCKLTLIIDSIEDGRRVMETTIQTDDNSSHSSSDLKWVYLNNTYLSKGKYGVRIGSNAQTDLDVLAIYPENAPYVAVNFQDPKNMLNSQEIYPPAYLTYYDKLSPTEYVLEIENATKPFVMSLAETYDPLWTAHIGERQNAINGRADNNNEMKINSIPLFSIINGFQINKTGSYSLTIKYEPQDWFLAAATVSAIVVVLLLATIIVYCINARIKIWSRIANRLRFNNLSTRKRV